MEPLIERPLAEVVVAVDDVGVRDEQFRAELVDEPGRLDGDQVGVDDRHQGRRLDGDTRPWYVEFADAREAVLCADLEDVSHCTGVATVRA